MTADPNTTPSAPVQAQSCFPPPPTIVPLRTLAMDRYLADPVQLHGLTARQVFEAGAARRYDATRLRRLYIEGTLERLADLRDRLIAKLDALDADPDLEPLLGASSGGISVGGPPAWTTIESAATIWSRISAPPAPSTNAHGRGAGSPTPNWITTATSPPWDGASLRWARRHHGTPMAVLAWIKRMQDDDRTSSHRRPAGNNGPRRRRCPDGREVGLGVPSAGDAARVPSRRGGRASGRPDRTLDGARLTASSIGSCGIPASAYTGLDRSLSGLLGEGQSRPERRSRACARLKHTSPGQSRRPEAAKRPRAGLRAARGGARASLRCPTALDPENARQGAP